jgi:hypothetical protein
MGTTHGAKEPGLSSHGFACQANAWGRCIWFCLGYSHIGQKIKSDPAEKIFCEAHNYVP